MISIPHPLDAAGAAELLARYAAEEARGTGRHFAVCWVGGAAPAPDGEAPLADASLVAGPLVGAVSVRDIDAEHRQAELSFWVGRPWWGRGLAPVAAAEVLRVAFGEGPTDWG